MKLDLNKLYDCIPNKDKEYCKKNRIHMEVVIIIHEPICVCRGLIDVKINSVYVAKINEEVVVNFTVTDDPEYINTKEDWSFYELKHDLFRGYPCKIYYK